MRFDLAVVLVAWSSYVFPMGSVAGFARMARLARVGKLLARSGGAMDNGQRAKTLNLYHADEALTTINAFEYIRFRSVSLGVIYWPS